MKHRVCPHCVTLFNYMGEDVKGSARYACTLLCGVHVFADVGMGSTDASADGVRVHIFDDTVAALPPEGMAVERALYNLPSDLLAAVQNTPEGERPFLPYAAWKEHPDQEQFWTLDGQGRDYIALGDVRTSGSALPTEHPLYRIIKIGRRQMGSPRMWHWRIEAR